MDGRKACIEFGKHLDPELPFTIPSHNQFYEVLTRILTRINLPIPWNGIPGSEGSAAWREQPGHLAAGQATYAVPGERSTRTKFHNVPLELPPSPMSAQYYLFEHSYV